LKRSPTPADNEILKLFPESPKIILVATGNIRSSSYEDRVRALSDDLANVPGVIGVQSISRGPKDINDALKSELWRRLLIAKNQKSSYVFVTLKERTGESTIRRLEAVQHRFDRPGFEVTMSGVPYITELIARNLARDLRVFSLAAFCIFGVVLFIIFRSVWILMGMFIACADASASTLIVTQAVHIPVSNRYIQWLWS
jgi:predicted RND superfamily exporter protein